jgi:hypothetical protein
MKALFELLPMGMKRAKSGLPLDSIVLPDSATFYDDEFFGVVM